MTVCRGPAAAENPGRRRTHALLIMDGFRRELGIKKARITRRGTPTVWGASFLRNSRRQEGARRDCRSITGRTSRTPVRPRGSAGWCGCGRQPRAGERAGTLISRAQSELANYGWVDRCVRCEALYSSDKVYTVWPIHSIVLLISRSRPRARGRGRGVGAIAHHASTREFDRLEAERLVPPNGEILRHERAPSAVPTRAPGAAASSRGPQL